MKKILVTGALGQIGTELVMKLRQVYGKNQVVATDLKTKYHPLMELGPYEVVNVMEGKVLYEVARKHKVDTLIHLAALLSAKAEKAPIQAWRLNVDGLLNALEVARDLRCQFFLPSSIGVFGPGTPKKQTPQATILKPKTIYGVSKVSSELLCDYYYYKYQVDTRGLRFPGLVSYLTPPGGGTTDYAVEIYYDAVQKGKYTSPIAEGTYMDMMYIPDALNAVITLMEADPAKLKHRNAYNVSAMSVAPERITAEIKKWIPDFEIRYEIDPEKQAIAESWPDEIDVGAAKEEWDFTPKYNLSDMTKDMLKKVAKKI